jgi:hypothetical protein
MAFNASTQMFVVHELEGWPENRERALLRRLFYRGANALSSQCLTSGGLRIKGGSASAVVQAHTAVYAVAKGILVTKAADTDMAALAGTVTNAKFNVFCHYVDCGGHADNFDGARGRDLGWRGVSAHDRRSGNDRFHRHQPHGNGQLRRWHDRA